MKFELSPLDEPNPRSRRIKTIVKYFTQSDKFDNEVNTAISDGWTLDNVKATSSDSMIMLFALLHRFEEKKESE